VTSTVAPASLWSNPGKPGREAKSGRKNLPFPSLSSADQNRLTA
jgi:hypothetical protein